MQESIMSASIRWALTAFVLMSGASGVMAQSRERDFIDTTRPDGGYPPDSQRANRAFWDYMDRWNK
jgi:hypothetical protein